MWAKVSERPTGRRRVTTARPVLLAALFAVLAAVPVSCARPVAAPGGGSEPVRGPVVTAGCATATSPPATSIAGTPQPANQEALDRLADRVRVRAQRDFGGVYAGVALQQMRDRIQVYRRPSTAFDRWVLDEFAADCVELVDARYSERELAARAARVAGDMDAWQRAGIPITMVAPDFITGTVTVGTTQLARARAELPGHYGPGVPLVIQYQEVNPADGHA